MVEGLAGEKKELETAEEEEYGRRRKKKVANEMDEAKNANVTCFFFTIEAHCS